MSTGRRRYLPISFDVANKRIAVAGNGAAALAKLQILARTQARITVFSPAPSLELAAAAPDWKPAYPTTKDLDGVALLFVATGDEAEDERLAALGRSLDIAVNVVDRPHLATFAMPAIVDRGPVTVAISSDGSAPVLAQRVRGLVDALLPATLANLGDLARLIRAAVLERLPSSAARRRFWWRAFDGAAGTAALSGEMDRAQILALEDLDAIATTETRGTVFLVAVPAEIDLLTLRAQKLLLSTDAIVHDAGVPELLLAMGRREATCVSGNTETALRLARTGKHVVRLAFSPSAEFDALARAGIDHEIVPVASAPAPVTSIAA